MDDPTLQLLGTVAGVASVGAIVTEVIVRLLGSGFDQARFGPFLAILVGIALAVLATFALGLGTTQTIAQAVLTGLLGGAASMGIHDLAPTVTAGGSA